MHVYAKIKISVLACVTAALAPVGSFADNAGLAVQVLDTRILMEPRIDDLKIAELSGLAYDSASRRVYAVSDRSRLFAFDLDLSGARIAALAPVSGRTLMSGDGVAMRDLGFNPEDIVRNDDDTFMIVSEAGPRISQFSRDGTWLADVAVPDALSDVSKQRSDNDGLESLAAHPTLGLLTAPEEPLEAAPRHIHTIHAETGETLSFDTTETGTTSIKALNVLPDGRLLVLERDRAADDSLLAFLRVLDPMRCVASGMCDTDVAQIMVPDIDDADFEGLTRVGDDLYLIVSDDKIGREDRSVFALLRVTLPARR